MDEDEGNSVKDSLILGWGCVLAAALSGGLWSSRFLLSSNREAQTTLSSFWPLAFGMVFVVIAFRIGLSIISQRRFYTGLSLALMSILLPVFGALWPFALKILHVVSDQ